MKSRFHFNPRFFVRLALVILLPNLAQGFNSRLVLIGGGVSPEGAIKQFANWAGDNNARILFIAWATSYPETAFQNMKNRFHPYSPKEFELAQGRSNLSSETIEQLTYDELRKKVVDEICNELGSVEGRKKIQMQIQAATGIFFSGGDQDFVMDILERNPDIKELLKTQFQKNIVFGGTSAGTAIMSHTMITQKTETSYNDYYTRPGLGLLPSHVVVDQHFFQRPMRIERLTETLKKGSETIGVGVDEDNAVMVLNGQFLKASGEGKIWIKDEITEPQITLLVNGEGWDLVRHQKIRESLKRNSPSRRKKVRATQSK